ncbi:MAG TPA: indole-3-glycerol phosphate synthase TrpC [Parafilimonas sp.]|nr:indole-3-glycerol phosphate synthase TrpC [Parafilimonas sp.]
MNILETIVAQKKKEVEEKKAITSIDALMKNVSGNSYSLKDSLNASQGAGIIAEFKRKSPSKGWIHEHINVTEVVPAYEANGAAAASILTDKNFFGGDLEDLKSARHQTKIPLLRKDFMIDEYQLYEAKSFGADVILLIAACLSKQQTKELAKKAKELKLEVLLEIHSEKELDYVCDEVDVIGINNRNLETFKTDVQISVELIKKIHFDKPLISESGIDNIETILQLHDLGFKGFLIGEYFMKQQNPAIAFADFMNQLKANLQ